MNRGYRRSSLIYNYQARRSFRPAKCCIAEIDCYELSWKYQIPERIDLWSALSNVSELQTDNLKCDIRFYSGCSKVGITHALHWLSICKSCCFCIFLLGECKQWQHISENNVADIFILKVHQLILFHHEASPMFNNAFVSPPPVRVLHSVGSKHCLQQLICDVVVETGFYKNVDTTVFLHLCCLTSKSLNFVHLIFLSHDISQEQS